MTSVGEEAPLHPYTPNPYTPPMQPVTTALIGLGYWGRSVYGFSNSGQLIEIDRTTGAGRLATTMTGTDRFWGAGVTTQAPVLL